MWGPASIPHGKLLKFQLRKVAFVSTEIVFYIWFSTSGRSITELV